MNEARRAFLDAPIAPMTPVIAEPMFSPMITGIALLIFKTPVSDKDCRMPIEAEELCRMTVIISPARSPRTGLENAVRMPVNFGSSARGAAPLAMMSMPIRSTAKLVMMLPISRCFCFLHIIIMKTPMIPTTGEKFAGLSIDRTMLSP